MKYKKRTISINTVIKTLLLFIFTANVADSLFVPVLALFITDFIVGATFATVGFAAAWVSITKSLIQIPLSRYLDTQSGERDDFWALLGGATISTLASFLLLLVVYPWQLYAVNALFGIGSGFLMAAYYAVFAHHIDKGSEGFEWSLFSVVGLTISTAIGSAIGGMFADAFGLRPLILVVAIGNACASFLLIAIYPYLLRETPRHTARKRAKRNAPKSIPARKTLGK